MSNFTANNWTTKTNNSSLYFNVNIQEKKNILGKAKRGRPKSIWKRTIKKNLGRLSITDELCADRREWRIRISKLGPAQSAKRSGNWWHKEDMRSENNIKPSMTEYSEIWIIWQESKFSYLIYSVQIKQNQIENEKQIKF